MPADSPAQPALNHVLQLIGEVVEEGRNTVRGLRSSIVSAHDLEYSFSRIAQEPGLQQETDFRIIVEGPAVPLQPAVRNDIYRIGREALVNAFRHSRARNVELELEYAANQLRLLVRDNGRGIDPERLRSALGCGLSSMRERAKGIGGKLKVSSSGACGTEVELRLPSRLAFESYSLNRASNWLTVLYAREQEAATPENEKLAAQMSEDE
jgi:signal transduction histidine kinase